MSSRTPFRMDFDIGTIKHLGLQMYSTLPPVIGELVANAWDANATEVEITIPTTPMGADGSEITIRDNGLGMSDQDIRDKYLIVGRDRREKEGLDETPKPYRRKLMGRKGIGKFSAFGIAREIEIESVVDGEISRFVMDYDRMLKSADNHHIEFAPLEPSDAVSAGTTVTLRRFVKFRTRKIPLEILRRGLARRFAVISSQHDFQIIVNGRAISADERDMQRLLGKDADGNPYLWPFDNEEIVPETGWRVSGWIGAVDRTTPERDRPERDRIDRGISIMARGKMVQEPFLFDTGVGQQFAISYLIGEIHAEFVDEEEDTIGTSRNTLVWDSDRNVELKKWGQRQVKKVAREWAERRSKDTRRVLDNNELYKEFKKRAKEKGKKEAVGLAEKLVSQVIKKNPTATKEELAPIIKSCIHFLEFDAFGRIISDFASVDLRDVPAIFNLFRDWEVVEAMEMSRVMEGRIGR